MDIIIHPPKLQNYKSCPKVKFKYPKNFFDIIISQQSLPTNKSTKLYYPIVDVSKKFEESIEKCRKKDKIKIKAIERTTISKNLSRNIIENYKKLEQDTFRNRCSSDSNDQNLCRNNRRASELVDQLLLDIYGRSTYTTPDIDQKFETEYFSSTSMRSYTDRFDEKLQCSRLKTKSVIELNILIGALKERVNYSGILLVKQLKKKDALKSKQEKICNVITAHLQAFSGKKSEDTNMRFSPNPIPGDSGFNQWRDAMKMVAKLPGGIPPEFRKKLWLALAEKHLQSKGVNWTQTEKVCFNEWSNPDDSELGIQIVKDLHRTGCSLFCGAAGQENQALLKRVLLAYARWNKSVGYCQGFNMLAALILQVMDKNETDSVKVMIYLIEGVLPESYFANNLRGLSVDMIVFRDLLKMRLPVLSKHLEALQNDAREGNSYEPPLTNVFTMQWFLTLFCNCLPQSTVLRVWDLIFLEGNEILLRTAIAIWEKLSDRILAVNSADEFYSIMGVLTREMLEFGLVDSNTLIKSIVAIGTCTELNEMRDRYLYNITPWTQSVQSAAKKGFKLFYSDDDEGESDYDEKAAVTAAYGISIGRKKEKSQTSKEGTTLQPYTHHPDRERLALDISALKKQYAKLRERQRQAHIILQAACARQPMGQTNAPSPIAMNHLLLGKNAIVNSRGRRLGPPKGSIPPARIKAPTKKKEQAPPETIHWKDTEQYKRRQSYTEETLASEETFEDTDSSSYSDGDQSSTSTELCDEPGRLSDFDSDEKISDLELKKCEENQEKKKEEVAKIEGIKSDIKDIISELYSDSNFKNNIDSVSLSSKEEILSSTNSATKIVLDNINLEEASNKNEEKTPTNITNIDFLQFEDFSFKKEEKTPNSKNEEFLQSLSKFSTSSDQNNDETRREIYTNFLQSFDVSSFQNEDPKLSNTTKIEDNKEIYSFKPALQKQDSKISSSKSSSFDENISCQIPQDVFNKFVSSTEDSCFKIEEINVSSNLTKGSKQQNEEKIYKTFISSNVLSPEELYLKKEETDLSSNLGEDIRSIQNKEKMFDSFISCNILSPKQSSFKHEKTNLSSKMNEDICGSQNKEKMFSSFISHNILSPQESSLKFEDTNVSSKINEDIHRLQNKKEMFASFVSSNVLSPQESYLKFKETNVSSKINEDNHRPQNKEEMFSSFVSRNVLSPQESYLKFKETNVSSKINEDIHTPQNKEEMFSSFVSSNVLSPQESYIKFEETNVSSKINEDIHRPQNKEETFSSFVSSNVLSPEESCLKFEEENVSSKINEDIHSPQNKEEKYKSIFSSNMLTPENACFKKEETIVSSKINEDIHRSQNEEKIYKSFVSSNILSPENACFVKEETNVSSKINDDICSSQNKEEMYTSFISHSILSPQETCFKIEETNVSSKTNENISSPQNKEEIYKSFISSSILRPEKTCFEKEETKMSLNLKEEIVTPQNFEDKYKPFTCTSVLSPEKTCLKNEETKISSILNEDIVTLQNHSEMYKPITSSSVLRSPEEACFKNTNISSLKFEEIKTPEDILQEEEIFETFLQERVKILKENSSESLTSPKEEQNKSSELRRHHSCEENSKNNIGRSRIMKQQSFDTNVLPTIETSLWKTYKIDEESPKEEIEDKVSKKSLVDLLQVEDKRLELGRRNSERALKIIQENSLILHRILQQQKSSEKEDSEDELSRSPISRTFLRSESLLSKDEKTDEERSSKDGEEDLESGLESFSVSPALIEEEIDLKNEDTNYDFSNFVSSIESKIPSPVLKTYEESSPIISEEKTCYDVASSILDHSKTEDISSASNDNKYTVDTIEEEYTYSSFKFKENDDNISEENNTHKDLSSFFDSKIEDNPKYDYKFEDYSLSKYKFENSDENLKKYSSTKNYFDKNDEQTLSSDNNLTSPIYDRKNLSIDIQPNKFQNSPDISPPKNLSCLQFTSFQTENPCSSKFSPICNKQKQKSPETLSPIKSPKYLINLPTLSPPRRSLKSPLSPNRTFSPFPVQPTTRQPKELGVKLGIYKDLSPIKSPNK